ncbi:MAG: hypothetical protein ACXWKP_26345, partial [Bradyrhizobium sp.]
SDCHQHAGRTHYLQQARNRSTADSRDNQFGAAFGLGRSTKCSNDPRISASFGIRVDCSMKKLRKIILFTALLLLGLYGCFQIVFPTHTNRFRLTLSFNIDGREYLGSSVIETRWTEQPIQPIAVAVHIRGQAVFIDLGARGAIVAALMTGASDIGDDSANVSGLLSRAFSTSEHHPTVPELPKLSGRRNLTPDNMPRLIWFSDVADEKSARVFTIKELPALFGPTARLDAATIEVTSDPIVIDIDQKLPWYRDLAERQKKNLHIGGPGFELSYNMFIGDLS